MSFDYLLMGVFVSCSYRRELMNRLGGEILKKD